MRRKLLLALAAAILLSGPSASTRILAQQNVEDPTDIIADHIREQGYKCDHPRSASQDPQVSRPDEEVWLVTCEDATYRVRLVPDMAAKVERIE